MAEDSEQDKSERATPFKLSKAREKGSVARGSDLSYLTGLAAILSFGWASGTSFADNLAQDARQTLASAAGLEGDPSAVLPLAGRATAQLVASVGGMLATVFLVVLFFEVLQTEIIFSAVPLKLDFSRLNPATNLKRLISLRVLIETAKNLLKLTVYGTIAYLVISDAYIALVPTVWDAGRLGAAMAHAAGRLLILFMAAALLFALADQLIVRRDFGKKMRMSRRELRRENRDREGDPRIKQRRRQLHREFAKTSQSLRGVRGADVLITNPRHFAVGLRYAPDAMSAPQIVALGIDHVALRLRRVAFIYGITILEDPPLARALHGGGVLDREIPSVLYQPVADVYLELRRRQAAVTGVSDD